MNALPPDDSAAIADAVRRLFADRHAFGAGRQADLDIAPSDLSAAWRHLAELGLCGLMLDARHGGVEAGAADVQRVQHELGAALAVAPWLQTLLCAQLVRLLGTPGQQDALLPAVARGDMPMAWADLAATAAAIRTDAATTPVASVPPLPPGAQARRHGDGWLIDGAAVSVPHAPGATRLVVSADLAGGGTGCFLLDPRQDGVTLEPHRLVDGSWSASLTLRQARAERLGEGERPGDAGATAHALDTVRALHGAALCAEACGMAEAALAASVQHLRSRQQFGQALGEYQALRHRVAEMLIALEQARSACTLALEGYEAWAGEAAENAARARAGAYEAARASAQGQLVMSESVTWILQQAIQLHGGMGMTEDMAVGHYYRRMLVINAATGGASGALRRLTGLAAPTGQPSRHVEATHAA